MDGPVAIDITAALSDRGYRFDANDQGLSPLRIACCWALLSTLTGATRPQPAMLSCSDDHRNARTVLTGSGSIVRMRWPIRDCKQQSVCEGSAETARVVAKLRVEKSGRGGKTVTVVTICRVTRRSETTRERVETRLWPAALSSRTPSRFKATFAIAYSRGAPERAGPLKAESFPLS